ncbi:MAG: sulfur oxidation c-type cytochrome SoxX [Ponticaulis sp.]|nr:sulfur oxidation c-type cytochrome SoxX [Ponticaulis sp.]|tara:strand:- start:156 stop:590 length:435 start_codon:yes stop_codon:yes gene_type:complete
MAVTVVSLSACENARTDTLIQSSQIQDDALPEPLIDIEGEAKEGEQIFDSRDAGHCVLCHQINGLDVEFQGDVGPELTGVGARLTPGQIRLRIVDYQRVQPGVTMPSYYRIHDLNQVGEEFEGQPVLTAEQIEHLVAFLSDQKG